MRLNQTSKSGPSPEFSARGPGFISRLSQWNARHPVLAIVLVSLAAVVLNGYPIIFCGRSYVSPTRGVPMVYDYGPPLPGMKSEPTAYDHGSDSVATLIWCVPMGFLESRCLLDHHELPLWNRYSHAGDTLIGQAVSMLGDPLQLIVILGRGSAGAWDIKYLMAKFLFCAGFGLLILRLLASRPLSLIFAALSAYCGAFFFINNHPAFFVFCYAPWILLSAIAFLDLESKVYAAWGLVWLLADFSCFNAGHVELAVVLICGLNLAAVAYSLLRHPNAAASLKTLARMTVGTLLFLGLTAPVWLSFLASLKGTYSTHAEIRVTQFPLTALLGIFDDVFFRLPLKNDSFAAPAPGTSLLVAVGSIFSIVSWRRLKGEPFFWINTAALVFWGGCAFGWVPATLLSLVPGLNRISHTYTEVSFPLVMHLTIQCAYGFKALAAEENLRRAMANFLWVGLILAAIILFYCFGITHRPIPRGYFALVIAGAFAAPLLFAVLKNFKSPIPAAGWLGILILGFIPQFRFGLYNFGSENFLMIPGPRVVLNAPSEAIARVQMDKSGPFRVVGVQRNMYGDYAAVYGLEDIRSSAPLSNGELVELIRKFPGITSFPDWVVEITDPVASHALLNLMNVKYLLTPPSVALQEGLDFRLTDKSDFGVLENLDVWPRAFFSDEVISISSPDEFIQHLLENGKQPFIALTPDEIKKEPALLQLPARNQSTIAAATNYQLLPNSTSFNIHAAAAGVVCLTEGQARDFIATANGEPKTVLTVNRAFKGIYLDKPGDYRIEFSYRPRHWLLACGLFWASAGIVVLLTLGIFFRGKFKKIEPPPNPDIPVA